MKHFSKIQKQNDQYIYSPIDSINHRSPKAPKSCSWLPYSILSRPYRTTSIARQKNSHMYIHWKLAPFPIGNMRLFFFDLAHKFSQNGATSLKISRHTDQFLRAYFSLFSTQRICITPKSFRIIPINRIAPIGPLFQHLPSEEKSRPTPLFIRMEPDDPIGLYGVRSRRVQSPRSKSLSTGYYSIANFST